MRLSLPFIPLFGVASFIAVSREDDQIHVRGISQLRSSMVLRRAWAFGAWSPLYKTIGFVFGSLSWRA